MTDFPKLLLKIIDYEFGEKPINESYETLLEGTNLHEKDKVAIKEYLELIKESEVKYQVLQGAVLVNMVENDQEVDMLCRLNIPNWDDLRISERILALSQAFANEGFGSIRTYTDQKYQKVSVNKYELPDVKDSNNLEELVNSDLGKEMRNMLYAIMQKETFGKGIWK